MTERPTKILVVDDVPESVRLLEAVLVPRGYEVVTANDGLEALELKGFQPARRGVQRRRRPRDSCRAVSGGRSTTADGRP